MKAALFQSGADIVTSFYLKESLFRRQRVQPLVGLLPATLLRNEIAGPCCVARTIAFEKLDRQTPIEARDLSQSLTQ